MKSHCAVADFKWIWGEHSGWIELIESSQNVSRQIMHQVAPRKKFFFVPQI